MALCRCQDVNEDAETQMCPSCGHHVELRDEDGVCMAPARIRIPLGSVLELPEGQWRHGEGTLRLRFSRVLHELNRYDDEWAWVEGTRLNCDGGRSAWTQVQVRVSALPGDHSSR